MKIRIQTDLFFASAERLMVKPKPTQLPAQWVLNFQASFGGEHIERSYGFPAKPTSKQIKEKREVFRGVVAWYLYYN